MCDDDDHDRLIASVAAGDVDLSRRIMREHITACERRLMLEAPESHSDLRQVFADVVAAQ